MQLRRVEVEVRPEWLDALEPIVEQLRASCGLQPARLSKFEAGLLALGRGDPRHARPRADRRSPPTSTMGELAFAVLRRQLAVLRAKEPGTRLGEDPEELHDMRVATRRLRAALSLFADVLPVRAQVFREELGWLGRLLGAVRDLDVQLEGLAAMAATDGRPGARSRPRRPRPAGRAGRAARARARRRPRRHVERSRLGPLGSPGQGLDRHGTAGTGPPLAGHQGPGRDRPARPGAWRVTTRSPRRPSGPSGPASCRTSTRLRIRCKRLRYALEFSADVYGGPHLPLRARAHRAPGRARRACRTPRWRRSSWPTWPPARPTCLPPPSS